MTCLSDATCALYADRELGDEPRARAEEHLAECPRCRGRVRGLEEEGRVLAAALADAADGAPPAWPRPAWQRAAGWTAAAVAGLGLAGSLAARGGGAPAPDGWDVAVDALLFLSAHAGMLRTLAVAAASVAMAALTVGAAVLLAGRRAAVVLTGALVALVVAPAPAGALETRAGGAVSVPPGARLAGTLVASGDTVTVEGAVDGDLIVAARQVEVRGRVGGDLVVTAGTALVSGTVEGSVYALAGTLEVTGRVGRGVHGLDRTTTVTRTGRVGGDLLVVGRHLDVEGAIGGGVWLYGAAGRVAGDVAGSVEARAHRLVVEAPARIGGGLVAHVERAADLRVGPGVTVAGERSLTVASRGRALVAEPRVWFWLLVQFFGAAAAGTVALALVPTAFHGAVARVGDWWRSLGLGLAVLAGAPLAIALAALTLVGLPLALLALALYLSGLYAAKIVVGAFLGQALLRAGGRGVRASLPSLLVGLGLLAVLVELPWIGPLVHLVVLGLGLGAASAALYRGTRLSW
jgi:anti-sigma factor RsiW